MTNNTPDYEDNLYFNSQNTKKDLCITSEQLTEQWKKGELPSGWYYTKLWKGCNVIDYFIGNQFLRYDDSNIVEVLDPVPSYEEWKSSDKLILTLMNNIKEKSDLLQRAMVNNAQLKELLKEIRQQITEQVFGSPKIQLFEGTFDNKLLTKIDEALK